MSRLLPSRAGRRAVLAIDRQQLAWSHGPATAGPAFSSCSFQGGPAPELRDAVDGVGPGAIDVVAGNDLALHWVQAPPSALASFAELRLVAQARCVHLHGGVPSDWRIAADWQAGRPFVCAAMPESVLTPIERQLAGYRLVPRWHSAWSVLTAGVAQSLPADGWIALRSPARVVLWHCRQSQVDGMTSWSVDPRDRSAAIIERALQQKQLEIARAGHPDDGRLHWLDLGHGNEDLPAGAGLVPVRRDRELDRMRGANQSEAAAALALRSLLP